MIAALEQFVGGYMNNQLALGPGAMGAQAYGAMYGASPYGQPHYGQGAPYGQGAYGAMQQHLALGPGQAMPPNMHGGGGHQKMAPGTLRMRGIPFRSTIEDVLRFFNGFSVMPNGVVIGQRDGRATGDCFVTFTSPQEAQRAMVMNNKHMGTRYVELFST